MKCSNYKSRRKNVDLEIFPFIHLYSNVAKYWVMANLLHKQSIFNYSCVGCPRQISNQHCVCFFLFYLPFIFIVPPKHTHTPHTHSYIHIHSQTLLHTHTFHFAQSKSGPELPILVVTKDVGPSDKHLCSFSPLLQVSLS